MPFLKFSRDRRGYEYFSIVEPSAGRRGKSSRPRVLFWFRTPPQVKVGREPFTDEIRRAIEAQNPGLKFDWVRLMATPIPAPDAEHWRERRRAEKAARQAMRESGSADQEEQEGLAGQAGQEGQDGLAGQDGQLGQVGQVREDSDGEDGGDENAIDDTELLPAETTISPSDPQQLPQVSGGEQPGSGRRRRRRGRRKHPQTVVSPAGPAATVSGPIAPNVPVPPAEEV